MNIDSTKYGGLCQCGKEHQMATQLCVIEAGALHRFEDYMAQLGIAGKRCVVYDTNTYMISGLQRPVGEQEVIMEAEGLHADEVSTAELLKRMDADVEILIAVGGGTVHDIVRFCAKERNLPFVSVPTAASCDGFCSNVAAMTWYGYKLTMACKAPELVVADLNIIAEAPMYLTATGIGDMLGKFVALADWRICHEVTGEEVCPKIYSIMNEALQQVWTHCGDLLEGSIEAYEAITYGLLMSGLAMQMIGTSRPASGAEHHVSHFIEVVPAAIGVKSPALHGEKVGVGTLIASDVYHRMAQIEDISELVLPYEAIPDETLLAVFGERLFEAAQKENSKDCLAAVTPEALVKAWPTIRSIISEIPSAEEIHAVLEQLGAKRCLQDIGIPEEALPVIIKRSPLIRNRLTLMRMRRMLRLPGADMM